MGRLPFSRTDARDRAGGLSQRAASAPAQADVAMAPEGARNRRTPRAGFGRGDSPEVPLLAARYLSVARGDGAPGAGRRRATAQRPMGLQVRSAHPPMAANRRQSAPPAPARYQAPDADPARRRERPGERAQRPRDASQGPRLDLQGNPARVPSRAARQSRTHRGRDRRVRADALTRATLSAASRSDRA